jgi:hypothetical protein
VTFDIVPAANESGTVQNITNNDKQNEESAPDNLDKDNDKINSLIKSSGTTELETVLDESKISQDERQQQPNQEESGEDNDDNNFSYKNDQEYDEIECEDELQGDAEMDSAFEISEEWDQQKWHFKTEKRFGRLYKQFRHKKKNKQPKVNAKRFVNAFR